MAFEAHAGAPARGPLPGTGRSLAVLLAAPPAAVIGLVRAVWARPSLLVAGTLLLLCVPAGARPEEGSALGAVDVSALMLVVVVACRRLSAHGPLPIKGSVLLALAGLTGAVTAAALTATDIGLGALGWVRYMEIFVAVPLAVALALRTRTDVGIVLGAVIAIGLIEGAVGVYQFATGTGAGYGDSQIRAVGTFGSYDIMTMPSVVTISLLAALAVALGGRGRLRVVAGLCVPVLLAPLAMSLSRGSWLAAAAASFVVLAMSGWTRLLLAGVVCVLLAVVTVGLAQPDLGVVANRAGSLFSAERQPDRSVRDRYDLWAAAAGMWRDHPVTGVGVKNFRLWTDTYAPLSLSSGSDISDSVGGFRRVELESPHSLYLLFLSEQGIVGLLALAAFLLILLVETVRRLGRTRVSGAERVVGLFAIGLLARYLVSAIDGDLGGPGSVLQGLMLGVVVWFAGGARPRVYMRS